MSKILDTMLKAMENADKQNKEQLLSKEQTEALGIIKHLKEKLSEIEIYSDINIQEYWYSSAKEMLKKYLEPSFLRNFKKPENIRVYNFKSTNKEILNDLKTKIKAVPESILIKKKVIPLINNANLNSVVPKKYKRVLTKPQILPIELTNKTRGFIEKLAKQINSTYQNNDFDACSMCMRRLLEILLILTYQRNNKENDIKDNDNYKNLSSIINFTKSNNYFNLSKKVLDTIDEFRKLGNHSAHRIYYNCLKKEIDAVKSEFRVTVEELLYKSNIKK